MLMGTGILRAGSYIYGHYRVYRVTGCPSFSSKGMDPKTPMKAAFDKYGLDQNTVDFTGHALALHRDDE